MVDDRSWTRADEVEADSGLVVLAPQDALELLFGGEGVVTLVASVVFV